MTYNNEPSVGKVVGWTIFTLLLIAAIGWAIWAFTVATSDVKGQGDAIIEKNSAENWVAAQERFEEMYADIVASDQKIPNALAALEADPENPTLRTEHTGLVNYCLSAVGDYNAEARKYSARDFRSADLPEHINGFDSATDCK